MRKCMLTLQSLELRTRQQNWGLSMTLDDPVNLTLSVRILTGQYVSHSSFNITLYIKTSKKFFPLSFGHLFVHLLVQLTKIH